MDAVTPGPLTAHIGVVPHADGSHGSAKGIHLGRERVKWKPEVWERIDRAVLHEFRRTRIAAKFLPQHHVDPHVTNVPADQVLNSVTNQPLNVGTALGAAPNASVTPIVASIDEGATTRLIEAWVEFSLTAQQVEQENNFNAAHHEQLHEEAHSDPHQQAAAPGGQEHADGDAHGGPGRRKHASYSTAVTLAARAGNILSLAQDAILFQGQIATQGAFIQSGLVGLRGTVSDYGLLCVGPPPTSNLPASQVVVVQPISSTSLASQTLTFAGSPTGGTFTLTYNAQTSAAINWAAQASLVTEITTALTSAPINIPAGNVSVAPGPWSATGGTIVVALSVPTPGQITVGTDSLTPAGATVTIGQTPVAARYVENTVGAIAKAYSQLQAVGHNGPYTAVLYFYDYSDTFAPLASTLILPADRIQPLMTEGYFGTGTVPGIPNPVTPNSAVAVAGIPNPTNVATQAMGLVVSTGGNTMDMVIGQNPVTAFSQMDQYGNHLFRVLTRFALRLKDPSAVIRLEFQ
jgi:uncharacterized linocin/CFP29 family protein